MENRRIPLKFDLIIFGFFLSLYLLICRGEFYAVDEMGRYGLTKTIAFERDLTVTRPNGTSSYIPWPILQSVLAVPLFALGGLTVSDGLIAKEQAGRLFVSFFNPIIGALNCVVFFRICLRMNYKVRSSLLSTFVFGLCTILLPYCRTFLSEPLTSLLLLTAVFLALSSSREKPLPGIASGFFLALATANNYVAAVVFRLVFLYFVFEVGGIKDNLRLRTVADVRLWTLVAFGCAAVLWVKWYDSLIYGSFIQSRLHLFKTAPNALYQETRTGFSYPIFAGIYGFLLSPGDSIFVFSPPLLGALVVWPRFLKERRKPAMLCFSIALVYLLIHSKFGDWWGGYSWGPRFLVPVTGFMLIPFTYLIEDFSRLRAFGKISVITLCLLGFYVQLVATLVLPVYGYVEMLKHLGGDSMELFMQYLPQACPVILQTRYLGAITSLSKTDLYFLKHIDSHAVLLALAIVFVVWVVMAALYLRALFSKSGDAVA